MQLSNIVISILAAMICGENDDKHGKHFPYRSSSSITKFFSNCNLPFVHDGSTRRTWVYDRLMQLNGQAEKDSILPSEEFAAIITGLVDPEYFSDTQLDHNAAIEDLNQSIARDSLELIGDASAGFEVVQQGDHFPRANVHINSKPLSKVESAQRARLSEFLNSASEDEFTEKLLVPFFQKLGFRRVNATGHKEKHLEFGSDLWMKYELPTGHWLYFCAQIKREKIDSKGKSEGNVTEVLNQARMAMDYEIFDPDYNKKVLLDHVYIISANDITRAARLWLAQKLDTDQRRRIIFMERNEFLSHAARIVPELESFK